jgi:hypothetical protein
MLERIRQLEMKLQATEQTANLAMTEAVSASVIATAEPEPEPITEAVTTLEVPESSDDGPPEEEKSKPAPAKKPWYHHWI